MRGRTAEKRETRRGGVLASCWAAVLAGVGCSTMQATSDYDRTASFIQYRTFKMLDGKMMPSIPGAPTDTLARDRIRDEITKQLVAKGLLPTATNPDLLVGFVAGAQRREELEAVAPYDSVLGPYPGLWGPGDVWTTEYQHGTLVIDLIDAHTKKMVWRSIVEVDKNKLSELSEPNTIRQAVHKAFQKFPPPPPK
jgi:Domain of unknown function (DUF4136)